LQQLQWEKFNFNKCIVLQMNYLNNHVPVQSTATCDGCAPHHLMLLMMMLRPLSLH
jgi:hypothetical protein